eukprot:CAMPEP_0113910696 /NCGR_PEP_ID=MMETSP0780_2-20120614/27695_1 /TAXON_ID=652834 /ORGANISM="Palpitomonas bilix" /LENGTH=230 /DNA_ID=CAMNT_0000906933 /DNA_START=5 /DNA_END=695 /DNA_ORIENTATION=- /assembly_acc=CAM_ASM_000599
MAEIDNIKEQCSHGYNPFCSASRLLAISEGMEWCVGFSDDCGFRIIEEEMQGRISDHYEVHEGAPADVFCVIQSQAFQYMSGVGATNLEMIDCPGYFEDREISGEHLSSMVQYVSMSDATLILAPFGRDPHDTIKNTMATTLERAFEQKRLVWSTNIQLVITKADLATDENQYEDALQQFTAFATLSLCPLGRCSPFLISSKSSKIRLSSEAGRLILLQRGEEPKGSAAH